MSVEADLLSFIETELAPSEPLDRDTDLLLTGLVDSLGVMRIVEWIERSQGIEVHPADVVLENFRTVSAMVAYVDGRTSGSETAAAS